MSGHFAPQTPDISEQDASFRARKSPAGSGGYPGMAGLTLSEQARAELEETFRSTQDRRLAERCQAVLMAARGRKP
jgi:hypothetical protein